MLAYQTDENGIFIGEVVCQLSPLDPEETWLIPAGAVTKAPPKYNSGQQARWTGKKWEIEEIPTLGEATLEAVIAE